MKELAPIMQQRHAIYFETLRNGINALKTIEKHEKTLSSPEEIITKDDEEFKKIIKGMNWGVTRELQIDGLGDIVKDVIENEKEKL